MATGVVRQRRETRIGPVGVVRTNSGTDTLGGAIKDAADQLSNRYYKIAAAKAKKTGQLQAAEVNLERITTLDENTLMPQALKVADQMGNIQREAFENAILLRFEGALADDISAKKAELMARVAPNRNAPQQFEQLFSEYLTATGANASGYYKQVITDLGASALDDGRSKLKVAQIQRIQAEAAEAKRRQDEEYVKSAYAQGLAGVAFQHTRNKTIVKNNAGGHVNHSFFWPLLKKDTKIKGEILKAIEKDFNKPEIFMDKFKESALKVFGSGWTWLVLDNNKLEIR